MSDFTGLVAETIVTGFRASIMVPVLVLLLLDTVTCVMSTESNSSVSSTCSTA